MSSSSSSSSSSSTSISSQRKMKDKKHVEVSDTAVDTTTNKSNNTTDKVVVTAVVEEEEEKKQWIRGLNIGGWLVLERYITPYQFAITNCHVNGQLCWYPGQISAPSPSTTSSNDYKECNLYTCQPLLNVPVTGGIPDYPIDEYTLSEAFLLANRAVAAAVVDTDTDTTEDTTGDDTTGDDRTDDDNDNIVENTKYRNPKGIEIATEWFNTHFENFVTEMDIQRIAASGITHLRVPMPHYILGTQLLETEPWIIGNRWEMFIRLCYWAYQYDLQIWPDIHTAPGSQNGFDNSGQALNGVTCTHWSNNQQHVQRSLQVIQDVCNAIIKEDVTTVQSVITGFGILNEPFKDCNRTVYEQFIIDAKHIVRTTLNNNDIAIIISDMFLATTFNDGQYMVYNEPNIYLDSHYYHVFAERPRELSPRQHIAYTCQHQYRDAIGCCYVDGIVPPNTDSTTTSTVTQQQLDDWMFWKKRNTDNDEIDTQEQQQQQVHNTISTASTNGIQRLIGEWSVAYDTLPVAKLLQVMQGIASTGIAPEFDRILSKPEIDFLYHFSLAQMIAYESVDTNTSIGWFYWTMKMEGGAFAEWDYLRGLHDGFIPNPLPNTTTSTESIYGTCYDIIFQIPDDTEHVIHTFPDPTEEVNNWQGVLIDDDVVVSHGQSLVLEDGIHHKQRDDVHEIHLSNNAIQHGRLAPLYDSTIQIQIIVLLVLICIMVLLLRFIRYIYYEKCHKQSKYTRIDTIDV